jgi:hypothetical protein
VHFLAMGRRYLAEAIGETANFLKSYLDCFVRYRASQGPSLMIRVAYLETAFACLSGGVW